MIKLMVLLAGLNGDNFVFDHDLTPEDCSAYVQILNNSNPLHVEYTCEVQEG